CFRTRINVKRVLDLALKVKIEAQLSLTRYIKCGVGLCGSCVIDGLRVCTDGPVFSSKILDKIKEFGTYSRDASGRRVKIQ
ncbi:MAG: dihydroorotate dehydrogenase electron transfer subunit, partial [Candidatus Bathyarchaeota archaeon]|nr:dihydroorotate dehydrogenase electron transfer subunit [Candidatus Bathyarchaeota archaeon]